MLRLFRPLLALLLITQTAVAEEAPHTLLLRLDDAVAEALQHSPALASARAQVKASAGLEEQAGALPNPALGVEAENFGGDGAYNGFDSAEVTYGLSQQIELGGKRSARSDAAHYSHDIAKLNAEAARLDVIRDVTVAYADAVAAQEKVRFAEEQYEVAGQELKNVTRRVNEAASPLMQKSKAEIARATSQFALEEAKQDSLMARKQLAVLMGRQQLGTDLDAADFFAISQPKSLEQDTIASTPDIARWKMEKRRAESVVDLEEATAIPDPTLSLGVRELRATDDRAFVLGVALPIPVFNANSGNISRAKAELTKTESDQRLVMLQREQEFARAQGELNSSYIQAMSLRDDVLPAAEASFEQSRYGYNAGKFPYLEVLDAQRTLFDARNQYITALRNYHARRAELERIAGVHHTQEKGDHHEE